MLATRSVEVRKGYLFALGAFGIWGLVPLFWRQLVAIPSLDLIIERILWAAPFFAIVMTAKRSWGELNSTIQKPMNLLTLLGTAVLIAVNWGVYVWAVNAGHVVEASLGYFLNPLVNIALGSLVLGESLNARQRISVAITFSAVVFLFFQADSLWISLTLAGTFGLYGLLRKQLPVSPLTASSFECFIVAAVIGVAVLAKSHPLPSLTQDAWTTCLLIFTGPLTAVPLLWFNEAAKRIPLSHLGFIQYLSPTLQFLLGVIVFQESFDSSRFIAFFAIWFAIALVVYDALSKERRFP